MNQQLEVNVGEILKKRAPGYYKWIPAPVIRALERYVCQDELNRLLRVTAGMTGSRFAAALLRELNVDYSVEGTERLPDLSVPVTYASNHPLGALDGICLIDWVARRHGCEPAFIVNDLLSVVGPLNNIFIPVNKHGRQSRDAVTDVDHAFSDLNRPVIMFPAGICSRRQTSKSEVRDLKWNKMFIRKSAETGRSIVPLRFEGENSAGFYRMARRREHLGIKFNIEMIRLPRELVLGAGKHFNIKVGATIPTRQLLNGGHEAETQAAGIRDYIYTL